jgi:hypothetical protein
LKKRVLLAIVLAVSAAGCAIDAHDKVALHQLYTPHFAPPPPPEPAAVSLRKWYEQIHAAPKPDDRSSLLPNQAGVLWLSLAIVILVGFDFRNPWNPHNVDLLMMQLAGWLFFDILGFLDHLQNPTVRNVMDWVFTAIVVVTVALLVRAIRRVFRSAGSAWQPGAAREALAVLAIVLVALDVAVALYSPPDDAGYFINIGAQRLRERVRWPYGDPLLTATPAAAYGPVLYLAHLPFQLALSPSPVNAQSPPRPPIESSDVYFLPPLAATKFCTAAFQLLAAAALFVIGRRLRGATVGWALVVFYCGSAYVLGVGGERYFIGGMTFVSHIAPAATTLLAFALLPKPAWSGAALAASVGTLFYPIFMVPAWLGYYWKDKVALSRFVVGFGVVAVAIAGLVLMLSRPAAGHGLIGTIASDTLGHQESPEAYGSSPFGFWGQRDGVRQWLMTPLAGNQSMTRPVVLMFFVFATSMFVVAQQRTAAQFALVVGAVAIGAELWKIHATATYVTWYYPFLLIGFLCGDAQDNDRRV